MRPERLPLMEAGPTAVQDCWETELTGSWVKMRKEPENWSATGSPRPEPGTDSVRVSFQSTRLPSMLDDLLWMRSVQSPCEPKPLNVLSGICGLYGPAPMPVPATVAASWIGVVAESSRVVLVKLA